MYRASPLHFGPALGSLPLAVVPASTLLCRALGNTIQVIGFSHLCSLFRQPGGRAGLLKTLRQRVTFRSSALRNRASPLHFGPALGSLPLAVVPASTLLCRALGNTIQVIGFSHLCSQPSLYVANVWPLAGREKTIPGSWRQPQP